MQHSTGKVVPMNSKKEYMKGEHFQGRDDKSSTKKNKHPSNSKRTR